MIVRRADLSDLQQVLAASGYARQEGGTESNFVLAPLDTKVDVHAIDLDVQGNGVYRMEDSPTGSFRLQGLPDVVSLAVSPFVV